MRKNIIIFSSEKVISNEKFNKFARPELLEWWNW